FRSFRFHHILNEVLCVTSPRHECGTARVGEAFGAASFSCNRALRAIRSLCLGFRFHVTVSSRICRSRWLLFSGCERTGQSKLSNFIFSKKYDARPALSVNDELLQHLGASRKSGNAVVGADGHHAALVL